VAAAGYRSARDLHRASAQGGFMSTKTWLGSLLLFTAAACGGQGTLERIDARTLQALGPGRSYETPFDHPIELDFTAGPMDLARVRLVTAGGETTVASLVSSSDLEVSQLERLVFQPPDRAIERRAAAVEPVDSSQVPNTGGTSTGSSSCFCDYHCWRKPFPWCEATCTGC
jgi:hypothetical protein